MIRNQNSIDGFIEGAKSAKAEPFELKMNIRAGKPLKPYDLALMGASSDEIKFFADVQAHGLKVREFGPTVIVFENPATKSTVVYCRDGTVGVKAPEQEVGRYRSLAKKFGYECSHFA